MIEILMYMYVICFCYRRVRRVRRGKRGGGGRRRGGRDRLSGVDHGGK